MPKYTLVRWVVGGWQSWSVYAKNKKEAEEEFLDLCDSFPPDEENLRYGDEKITRERGGAAALIAGLKFK